MVAHHITSRGYRRAAAAVELALILPLMMFLFVAGVDFARIFNPYLTITNCARNGAIYGSESPTKAVDTAGIEAAALADASNLSPAPLVSSTTGTDTAGNDYVELTVTGSFQTISNYPGIPSALTIKRTVRMRVVPPNPQ